MELRLCVYNPLFVARARHCMLCVSKETLSALTLEDGVGTGIGRQVRCAGGKYRVIDCVYVLGDELPGDGRRSLHSLARAHLLCQLGPSHRCRGTLM